MARKRIALAIGLAGVAAGTAIARRRSRRPAPDATFDDYLRLPEGSSLTVETDDGARLAVEVAGEGPTIVLSHGFTNTGAVWSPVAHLLVESGHRVVTWDQRGHGASTLGRDRVTISRLGADLLAVVEEVDARDAVLVGHSMGGMTTMALLGDRPDVIAERVKEMILVSTAAAGMSRGRRSDRIGVRVVSSPRVTAAMGGSMGPRLTRRAMGKVARPEQLAALASLFASTSEEARAACFAAIAEMDLRPALAAANVPVTVLVGSRDYLTQQGLGQAIVDVTPGARLEVFPDAGHMLQWERTERVAEIIAVAASPSQIPEPAAAR